jgi:hypothetical protein
MPSGQAAAKAADTSCSTTFGATALVISTGFSAADLLADAQKSHVHARVGNAVESLLCSAAAGLHVV